MLQVLDALASAHGLGIIHQDIKPANIMLTSEKRVKVTDFGISRFANTEVTSVSSSMGTPNYMSPEQCRGGPVDGRSDIFSAGATLFEMLAGERAFPGHNVGEVTHRIQNRGLPLLPAPVRAVAPRLQLVLERAMEKQPENRFNTGDEMAEALRQVLNSSGAGEVMSSQASRRWPVLRVRLRSRRTSAGMPIRLRPNRSWMPILCGFWSKS